MVRQAIPVCQPTLLSFKIRILVSQDMSLEGVKPTNNGSTDQHSSRFAIKEIFTAKASSNVVCLLH